MKTVSEVLEGTGLIEAPLCCVACCHTQDSCCAPTELRPDTADEDLQHDSDGCYAEESFGFPTHGTLMIHLH
ncbi:hypothetical protein CIB48_g6012 [Xylaria polymorpha]|nr:hypothetical protein CIB48_g6012 [Xylaria polymorpha]